MPKTIRTVRVLCPNPQDTRGKLAREFDFTTDELAGAFRDHVKAIPGIEVVADTESPLYDAKTAETAIADFEEWRSPPKAEPEPEAATE